MQFCLRKESFLSLIQRYLRPANEEVVLHLIKVKCLPVSLYGVDVCPVNVSDMRSLEITVKGTVIKLFRTSITV